MGLRAVLWKVFAVLVIACVSVAAQTMGGTFIRSVTPLAAAFSMLIVAVTRRAPAARMSRSLSSAATLAWSTILLAATAAYVAPQVMKPADLFPAILILFAAALAEELIFRDQLLPALTAHLPLRNRSPIRRELAGIGLSQAMFAAVHVPVLLTAWRSGGVRLGLAGLGAIFAFGCLMAGMRDAGAGPGLRAVYHTFANVIALAVPLAFPAHLARLIGVTAVFLLALRLASLLHALEGAKTRHQPRWAPCMSRRGIPTEES